MKRTVWLGVVCAGLASGIASAQGVYYSSNVTTSARNVPSGAQAPVYTLPFAKVTICANPPTPTNAVCTNTVAIYSDQALTVPITQPLVSDSQGQYGFYINPGTYAQSIQSSSGAYLYTAPFTTAGGTPTAAQISALNANASLGATNTVLGQASQEARTTTNPTMATFQNALDNCQNQVVNLVYYFDSRGVVDDAVARIIGQPTVLDVPYGRRHADLMRQELQRRCPSYGTGLQSAISIMPFGYVNADLWTLTGVVSATTEIGPNFGGNGSVVVLTTGTALDFYVPDVEWDTPRLFLATDSSSTGCTVSVDGVSQGNAATVTTSSPAVSVWTGNKVPKGLHRMHIVPVANRCLVYGAQGINGNAGVEVSNVAVGSAPMEWFASAPATQLAFTDAMPEGQQLAVTNMVTNEPGNGVPQATYQASLQAFIAHEQALPSAPSVLFLSPMQDTIPGQAPYYPIMKSVAQGSSVGFLDMRDRVGTAFVAKYFGPDQAHENTLGNSMEYESILATALTGKASPSSVAACSAGQTLSGYGPHGTPVCVAPDPTQGTCGQGYSYYASLSIPTSAVKENVANFPVPLLFNGVAANSITLTDLKSVANSGKVQTTAADDVIVCSALSGGVQYPSEVVQGSYVATSGALEMYVRFPSLSTTAATTAYLFYGNPLAPARTAQTAVWSNGYAAVYHFGGASGAGYAFDSTTNGNVLAGFGGGYTDVAGKFGYYAGFTPSGGLTVTAPSGLPGANDARTIEGWFNIASCPSGYDSNLFGYGNFGVEGNFSVMCAGGASYPGLRLQTQTNIAYTPFTPDSNWHFTAATLPQGGKFADERLYLDGTTAALTTVGGTTTVKTQPSPIWLNGDGYSATESLDEVRYSTVERSAGWLATEYQLFTNPAAITIGAGTAAPNAPFTGSCASGTALTVRGGVITGCS